VYEAQVQVMEHARAANKDDCLRSLIKIASAEMAPKVPSSPGIGAGGGPGPASTLTDPPLINLELAASHTYLTVLVQSHVHRHQVGLVIPICILNPEQTARVVSSFQTMRAKASSANPPDFVGRHRLAVIPFLVCQDASPRAHATPIPLAKTNQKQI